MAAGGAAGEGRGEAAGGGVEGRPPHVAHSKVQTVAPAVSAARSQSLIDCLWLAVDNCKKDARCAVRIAPALLPMPHRSKAKSEPQRELLLTEPQLFSDSSHVDGVWDKNGASTNVDRFAAGVTRRLLKSAEDLAPIIHD